MYCRHCGHKLPDTAGFCGYCGKPIGKVGRSGERSTNKNATSGNLLEKANAIAARFVPRRLTRKFPTIMPVVFVGIYATTLLIAATMIIGITGTVGHDLSGTYATNEFFPVNTITFQTNGSFTAISYAGYTETYQGKYSKGISGKYTLRFTGGSASGGSPVTQYEADTIGQQYELVLEKVNESTLKVQVVSKIGYYAWDNKAVYFYKR